MYRREEEENSHQREVDRRPKLIECAQLMRSKCKFLFSKHRKNSALLPTVFVCVCAYQLALIGSPVLNLLIGKSISSRRYRLLLLSI